MYKTCYGLGPHVHLATAAVEIKLDSAKSVVLWDHSQAQISITWVSFLICVHSN